VKTVKFKFAPQQRVWIKSIDCGGRIDRCIACGGLQNLYGVEYVTNGEPKRYEFYEDELKTERIKL